MALVASGLLSNPNPKPTQLSFSKRLPVCSGFSHGLVAHEDLPQGSQLCTPYSDAADNLELLTEWGFAEPGNPNDWPLAATRELLLLPRIPWDVAVAAAEGVLEQIQGDEGRGVDREEEQQQEEEQGREQQQLQQEQQEWGWEQQQQQQEERGREQQQQERGRVQQKQQQQEGGQEQQQQGGSEGTSPGRATRSVGQHLQPGMGQEATRGSSSRWSSSSSRQSNSSSSKGPGSSADAHHAARHDVLEEQLSGADRYSVIRLLAAVASLPLQLPGGLSGLDPHATAEATWLVQQQQEAESAGVLGLMDGMESEENFAASMLRPMWNVQTRQGIMSRLVDDLQVDNLQGGEEGYSAGGSLGLQAGSVGAEGKEQQQQQVEVLQLVVKLLRNYCCELLLSAGSSVAEDQLLTLQLQGGQQGYLQQQQQEHEELAQQGEELQQNEQEQGALLQHQRQRRKQQHHQDNQQQQLLQEEGLREQQQQEHQDTAGHHDACQEKQQQLQEALREQQQDTAGVHDARQHKQQLLLKDLREQLHAGFLALAESAPVAIQHSSLATSDNLIVTSAVQDAVACISRQDVLTQKLAQLRQQQQQCGGGALMAGAAAVGETTTAHVSQARLQAAVGARMEAKKLLLMYMRVCDAIDIHLQGSGH